MLDGDVTDIVEAQSLSFKPQYVDIYLASWGPKDDGATLEGPGPLTRLALQNGIKKVRKRKNKEQFLCERGSKEPVFLCVCLRLCPTCGCIFTSRTFSPNRCVNIINKLITSVCFPPINFRAGVGGALFLSGRQGTEGEQVTTVPVTATAAASTPSLSAAALGVEVSLRTWRSAPPPSQQLSPVERRTK